MREMPGQASIMDELIDVQAAEDYAARKTCPHCALTYWASPGNPLWTLERQDAEHVEVEPGVCARMAEVRDVHLGYQTGRTIMEPHWTKRDYANYAFQAADLYDHVWRAYHSRQEAGA